MPLIKELKPGTDPLDEHPRSASGRAGHYEMQVEGHRAFMPAPLPPVPPLHLDRHLTRQLSRADRALAALDSAIQTLPDPDLFLFMYVRKEAVLSSQIEGTQWSLDDLLRSEAHIPSYGIPDDVGEVANYVRAMNHGLARLSSLPVSARLIREIHAELMRGVRGGERSPGVFRKDQVWIGAPGASIGEGVFVPPPHREVEEAIHRLEEFIHREDDEDDPPLVRVGLAHAQFETIHPFFDGNGRCGRLLITFLLCEQRLMTKPVLYLSVFLKAHRPEYYERLQAVRDRGDWEGWISFFLRGVEEVAMQACAVAKSIVALREQHWKFVIESFGAQGGKAVRVLEALYRSPITTVNAVAALLSISFANANQLVARLEQHGILREVTGQARNRHSIYRACVDLFTDL